MELAPTWQREKDSNPHIRSQSPLCYLSHTESESAVLPLHNPAKRKSYYTCFSGFVKDYFKISDYFLLCVP